MMGLLDPRLMQYLQQLGAMNQPGYNRPLPPPGVPGGVGPRPPMPGKPMMPNQMLPGAGGNMPQTGLGMSLQSPGARYGLGIPASFGNSQRPAQMPSGMGTAGTIYPRPYMPGQQSYSPGVGVTSAGSSFVPAQPRMSVDPRSYAMPPRGMGYGP